MSIETRKHIYDAFFSTKGSAGSGLGLWVTASIVKKHRGCIHVRSKRLPKTGGSLFNLVFPYRAGSPSEGSGCAGRRGTLHTKTERTTTFRPLRLESNTILNASAGCILWVLVDRQLLASDLLIKRFDIGHFFLADEHLFTNHSLFFY